MNLRELLESLIIKKVIGAKSSTDHSPEVHIAGLEMDSRKVRPGDLFICVRGFTVDGHDFARDAIAKGAVAVLTERELPLSKDVVQIVVPDTRRAMAILADVFYGRPTQKLKLIGVTGTNGKTSTTHFIKRILQDAGYRTGLIGTMYSIIDEKKEEVKNTTPDILELQRAFRRMVDCDTDYAIIEVSSHALQLGRVRGCDFHTGVFTNLTQDHLDLHKTMENYQAAKSLLFSQLGNRYEDREQKAAVLNADDPASHAYAEMTSAQVITYGIKNEADVTAADIKMSGKGTQFLLKTFAGDAEVNTSLIGTFSVYNALAAAAVGLAEGLSVSQIASTLSRLEGVDGRFERVDEGQDYTVIVDYAHTPDSLENVLKTSRQITEDKLYCVVGCGGDRDRMKRPLMAQIAVKYADHAIFTSDNPRSEDPQSIIDEMVQGVKIDQGVKEDESAPFTTILDRKSAIYHAVRVARSGDTILIAGKGHETYQIIGQQVYPFDDREVAREAIRSAHRSQKS